MPFSTDLSPFIPHSPCHSRKHFSIIFLFFLKSSICWFEGYEMTHQPGMVFQLWASQSPCNSWMIIRQQHWYRSSCRVGTCWEASRTHVREVQETLPQNRLARNAVITGMVVIYPRPVMCDQSCITASMGSIMALPHQQNSLRNTYSVSTTSAFFQALHYHLCGSYRHLVR